MWVLNSSEVKSFVVILIDMELNSAKENDKNYSLYRLMFIRPLNELAKKEKNQ